MENETKKENKIARAIKKLDRMNSGFWAEFRAFINKGNVVQLAIAFIMGATFTAIVTSLVGDIFMPVIGLMFGGVNINDLQWNVRENIAIRWGAFLMTILNFIFIALILFLVIKIITGTSKRIKRLRKIADIPLTKTPLTKTEQFLSDIRDLLQKQTDPKTPPAK
jgi:large conductance mechanosensitive channel